MAPGSRALVPAVSSSDQFWSTLPCSVPRTWALGTLLAPCSAWGCALGSFL